MKQKELVKLQKWVRAHVPLKGTQNSAFLELKIRTGRDCFHTEVRVGGRSSKEGNMKENDTSEQNRYKGYVYK